MIAVKVEKQKNGKFKVETDDDITFFLYYKELKSLGIEEGKVIEVSTYEKVIKLLVIRGKKRIFYLLGKKDYLTTELYKKLSKDGYPEEVKKVIIAYFQEKGFVDDFQYAKKYYECYKGSKSRRIIEKKLNEKGIDRQILKEVFEVLDEESETGLNDQEYETARRTLFKKFGRKDKSSLDFQKMIRFMTYRGFSYDVCRKVINELLNGIVDDEQDEWF